MKQSRLLLTTFLLLGCHMLPLSAQHGSVEWLTTKQGLSQGFVSCLLQDREGFIWAGTKNGLNRYDGYRFEVFTNDPYDEFTLSNDFVTCLNEYGDFIIIGTEWGGINLLHKKTRKIYRLHCETPMFKTPLEQCNITWVSVDVSGNIWAVVEAPNQPVRFGRLYKFSIPTEFWQNPPNKNNWQKNITLQYWEQEACRTPFMTPDKKFIFIPRVEGVFEFNLASSEWKQIAPPVSSAINYEETTFQSDEKGGYWVASRFLLEGEHVGNLYHYQPSLQPQHAPIQTYATNVGKFSLLHISHGLMWLNFFGDIRGYQLNDQGKFDINQPDITGLKVPLGACSSITDRSGIVWFGTNGLGIVKVSPRSKRFQNLFTGESVYSSILQNRKGEIIAVSNNFRLLNYPSSVTNSLVTPIDGLADISTARDESGTCWAAGRNGVRTEWLLKKIDPIGTSRVITMPYHEPNCVPIVLDAVGDPWFGLIGFLMHFDQKTDQFTKFDFREAIPPPHNVFSLARTADGTWWLATRNGLLRAKPSDSSHQKFDYKWLKNDPSSRNSLRNNSVASLLVDPNDPNILWIGTKGGGLDRLDVSNLHFTHLSTREGLPDNVIYGVLAESGAAETILWLSSNKGLIRYSPSTGAIKNYTEEDGIQGNEFNTYAYGKGPTGTMMFGGVNGMTVFHPQQLQEDTFAPRTLITRLRLNGRDVSWNDSTGVLAQGIEFTEAIKVPFSRNNLTLEFVSLNFTSTGKNRFRYYLEGVEKDWSDESAEHSAAYLNLAPGTYTFRVKGSNSEGVWGAPAELKITILPPWYRSWLAWISYVLIVGSGAYAFYRYQLRTKLEHAENQRLKELDNFKSRFFTNITHEFRTPLTVILGMADRLEKNDKLERTSALQLIRRNGQNLLRLINEILDLAKLESNTLQMDYVQGDVLAYLRYVSESLHSLANAKNVMLRVESDQAKIEMDYDPERLLQVIHNLLSNAIKFTPGGGRVTLRVELPKSSRLPGKHLQIAVSDTGVGIPPDELPNVFERFYQAKNQQKAKAGGTGVGLSLTRELVRAMGGEIGAESTVGKGSTFTVLLPVTNKARAEEQGKMGAAFATREVDLPKNAESLAPQAGSKMQDTELPLLLIIEDNPDVVEYLSGCLNEQYRLDYAYNGRAGIEKALEIIPDVILSDVMMPEKDGFEVCDTLKNDERSSHIPIVLLTARATVEDRIAGLRRGADAYLAKPFNPEELLATLDSLNRLRTRLLARYASNQAALPTEDKGLQIEDAFLLKVRGVVEANLSNSDFEMPHLQRKLAMSHSQIFRKLKALTGKSPSQFIRSIRLAKAKEMLSSSELTVSEIAYDTGFSSLQYFSDAFFEEFGRRPSAMRN